MLCPADSWSGSMVTGPQTSANRLPIAAWPASGELIVTCLAASGRTIYSAAFMISWGLECQSVLAVLLPGPTHG
jgi:hypothetical protein